MKRPLDSKMRAYSHHIKKLNSIYSNPPKLGKQRENLSEIAILRSRSSTYEKLKEIRNKQTEKENGLFVKRITRIHQKRSDYAFDKKQIKNVGKRKRRRGASTIEDRFQIDSENKRLQSRLISVYRISLL